MKKPKICMIGAGSGFVVSIARELANSRVLQDSTFALMDIDPQRLEKAEQEAEKILRGKNSTVKLETTRDYSAALDGCDYVITSCEQNRNEYCRIQ